jgi:phosphoesterase RecJ-like protein
LYKDLFSTIESSKNILLATHINPDGDTIGSALGFFWAFNHSKKLYLYNKDTPLPKKYDFLAGYDKFTNKIPSKVDLVITFDASSIDRFDISNIDVPIISIDHHMNHQLFGNINVIDTDAVSTSLVVYKILRHQGIKISKNIADAIYTGIVEDSGFFAYDRVNGDLFEVAASLVNSGVVPHYIAKMLTQREAVSKMRLSSFALANMELHHDAQIAIAVVTKEMIESYGCDDTTDIANRLRSLATVDVGILIKEEANGSIRVSLRSKNIFDVSMIAKYFGGGGHIRASGFTTTNISLENLKNNLIKYIGEIDVSKR